MAQRERSCATPAGWGSQERRDTSAYRNETAQTGEMSEQDKTSRYEADLPSLTHGLLGPFI